METPTFWKKCSSCKKEIQFKERYYLCSISTCRQKRTGLHFCSVPCWDAHLGFARHKDSAYAEDATAPSAEEYARTLSEAGAAERPARRIVVESKPAPQLTQQQPKPDASVETLVVVSRVKEVIAKLSDFNTSQCCIDALTKAVLERCKRGIERARADGRKTVMGRDIEP